jgi:hypothetical protein
MAAAGTLPATAAKKPETHRFRTDEFDIEMAVEYHDGYTSRGFWFRDGSANGQFCLSAGGEPNRRCLAEFRGSLAVAQYHVRPRSGDRRPPRLRELVRTVDRDPRLHDRPSFERAIALQKGVASDLQAFGYDATAEEESLLRLHSPWYLFRQDLFLEPQHQPFLAIFWKHALPSIRMLDIIPGERTWATKR